MKSKQSEEQDVIKVEEWLFLILIGMIPLLNLIAFIYFGFSRKVNKSKQNFARAGIIYLGIIFVLVTLTTVLL